jgi:hypothetical protein
MKAHLAGSGHRGYRPPMSDTDQATLTRLIAAFDRFDVTDLPRIAPLLAAHLVAHGVRVERRPTA